MSITLENHARLPDARCRVLAASMTEHRSVKEALDWLTSQTPARTISDLVALDEFSHEAFAEYADRLWLSWSVS